MADIVDYNSYHQLKVDIITSIYISNNLLMVICDAGTTYIHYLEMYAQGLAQVLTPDMTTIVWLTCCFKRRCTLLKTITCIDDVITCK